MRLIFHITRTGRVLGLCILVILALAVTAARIILPEIADYRAEFVGQVSEYVGRPVKITRITASLRGFEPQISMYGMEILDAQRTGVLLRFEELRAGLDLYEWVTSGEFQPKFVTVVGARFSVRREVNGAITVAGLDAGGEMPRWLFKNGHFELLGSQVVWQDLKRSTHRLEFSDVDIRLLTRGDRHRVGINLFLPEEYGKSLSLIMDYSGDIFLPDCCDGRMYAEGNGVEYGYLSAGLEFFGYGVHHGRGDFRLWSSWERSRPVSIAGNFRIQQPQLYHRYGQNDAHEAYFSVSELSAGFSWAEDADRWLLNIDRLSVGGAKALDGLRMVRKDGTGEDSLWIAGIADYLNVAKIRLIVQGLKILEKDQHERLEILSPRGEFRDIRAGFSVSRGQTGDLFVCTRFQNIGVNPWNASPGINELSGRICGNQDSGQVDLDGASTEFSLPKVFRYPMLFKRIRGKVHWTMESGSMRIHSRVLELDTPDISTRSRFTLDWSDGKNVPEIDLVLRFTGGQGNRVYRYLPVNVLSAPLIEWLDNALLSGVADSGGAVIRGPLDAFPFRANEGVFEILFSARDVEVLYHRDWPHAHVGSGEVRFYQAGMEITVDRSAIQNVPVDSVTVMARDFEFDDYLNIRGRAHGSIRRMFSVVEESPLWPDYKPLLSVVKLSGNNRLDLNLKIPIAEHLSEVLVDGVTHLKSAGASAFGMSINKIHGKLHFSHETLNGAGLRGMFLGKPVTLGLSDLETGLALDLSGEMEIGALSARYPAEIWRHFEGKSAYSIDLTIPELDEDLYADILLKSDLQGVNVRLPQPLAKLGDEVRSLTVKTHLKEGSDIPLEIRYGQDFRARLVYSGTQPNLKLDRGVVKLGSGGLARSPDSGIELYARTDVLDPGAWYDLRESLPSGNSTGMGMLKVVDVRTSNLKFSGTDFGPLTFRVRKVGREWVGYSKNQYIDGRLNTYGGDTSQAGIEMNLNHLRIPRLADDGNEFPREPVSLVPGSVPALKIRADRLFLRDLPLGQFELLTSRSANRMKIQRLTTRIDNYRLSVSGDWSVAGGKAVSSLHGKLEIDDLGRFMTGLGKSNVIKDTTAKSAFQLNWSGAPYDFSFQSLNGYVGIELGQGRLLTVESGFDRLFGLFNLDALKNLLLFDFGQLFGAGLAFDQVKSAFQLANGHATIERFDIDAVPAKIMVAGTVNLVREKLDDIVTVVPKGVVAFGASVLLNQQLPGHSVDGLISRQYQVTGNWDDPTITRLPGSGRPLHNSWLQNRQNIGKDP